ncbi:MAG: hypothetical protein CMH31_04015 [Micavibrio sp.]|nr:hypothetical protein [Micavibrio sp.]
MPLISTLKKLHKRQAASVQNFLDTPSIVYISQRFPQTHQASVNYWNDWIPYAPQEIAKIFEEECLDGFELHITPNTYGEFVFTLEQEGVGKRKQTYNFQYGFTKDSWTFFEENHRGGRIGRKMAMRFMELDVAFGIKKMKQDAGKLLGAYVWAAMGFNISKDNPKDVDLALLNSQMVLARLEGLRSFLPLTEFARAQIHAQGTNVDDMYHLAHRNFDLSSIDIDWDAVQLGVAKSLITSLAGLDREGAECIAGEEVDRMKPIISFSKAAGQAAKLGKIALVGRSWPSVVNYRDDQQMIRVQEYGGNFKTAQLLLNR